MTTLPRFPLDDETLALVELAINTDGVNVANTLDLLALGSGEERSYHWCDVIRALIGEVRRLRAQTPLDKLAEGFGTA